MIAIYFVSLYLIFLILHSEQIVPYRGRREGLRQSQVVPIPEFQMGSVVKVPCTLPLLHLDVILFIFSMGFTFFVLCIFIFLILQQPSPRVREGLSRFTVNILLCIEL
ncbi:hypothetical protein BDV19DRAFT_2531 [Aspergillus venezuelensis]